MAVVPAAASRARSVSPASAVRAAWPSFSIRSGGVAFGASSMFQVASSTPGSPASAKVGTSGSTVWRAAEPMASATTRLPSISEAAEARLSMVKATSPVSTACMAGPPPR